MAERNGFNSKLARAFWQVWPHTFGQNILEDMKIIKDAGRFAAPGQAVGAGRALADVMESVDSFFTGKEILQSQEKRRATLTPLNHIDSGLLAALGDGVYTSPEMFEEKKNLFLEKCPGAPDLLERYAHKMEKNFYCEDKTGKARLKDEVLRAGVHLVLLAHAFQAGQDGREKEAIFARKLLEIITVTEGMQASQLTRKDVFQALEAAVKEIKQEDVIHVYDTGHTMMEAPPVLQR